MTHDGLDSETFDELLALVRQGKFKSELQALRVERLAHALKLASDDQLKALLKASKA